LSGISSKIFTSSISDSGREVGREEIEVLKTLPY